MTKAKSTPSVTRRSFLAASAAAAASTFFVPRFARADEPEFTLKLGTNAPEGTPWEAHLKSFRKKLKEATNERLKIKAYFGGSLGDEQAVAEKVQRGTSVQMYGGTAGGLSSIVPELECIELPYLFSSYKQADMVMDAIFGNIDSLLQKHGMKLLFLTENGFRSVGLKAKGNSDAFVKSPSDLKGQTVRSQPTNTHLETWKALGAKPKPIAVTEVLTQLQSGAIDGFDNTPLFTFAASWHKGISHYTLTEHSYQPGLVVINLEAFNALPQDIKDLVLADPEGEARKGRKGVRAMNPLLIDNFKNEGIAVHESTASEKAALKAATAGVADKFRAKATDDGKALLRAIEAKL
jgi:TRAP-type C4-dicarboxylate transport system substrate-binding protein